MIKVIAKNFIKADKIAEFVSLAKQLVLDTRQNDAGCINYELLQDVSDTHILTMLEEWADKDSLNKHLAAKHFQDAAILFGNYTEKPGEINIYQTLA